MIVPFSRRSNLFYGKYYLKDAILSKATVCWNVNLHSAERHRCDPGDQSMTYHLRTSELRQMTRDWMAIPFPEQNTHSSRCKGQLVRTTTSEMTMYDNSPPQPQRQLTPPPKNSLLRMLRPDVESLTRRPLVEYVEKGRGRRKTLSSSSTDTPSAAKPLVEFIRHDRSPTKPKRCCSPVNGRPRYELGMDQDKIETRSSDDKSKRNHVRRRFQDQPSSSRGARKMVEVIPGVHARLRGSEETYQAIQEDFYVPTICDCCSSTVFVIQDAGYVLCPDCRVVYTVEEPSSRSRVEGGVGLGFKYKELIRWQQEIIEARWR